MKKDSIVPIYDAAIQLFIQKGYKETKMMDIAAAANVSLGTLYNNFASKSGLLDFIFWAMLEKDILYLDYSEPIEAVDKTQLYNDIRHEFESTALEFKEKFGGETTQATFRDLVNGLMDIMQNYGDVFLILSRNPQVQPELTESYVEYQHWVFAIMKKFIEGEIRQGRVRDLPNLDVYVEFLMDTTSQLILHKKYKPFFVENIPSYVMREIVLDVMTHTFLVSP